MKLTIVLAAAMAAVCMRAEAAPVTFTLVNGTYNDIALYAGARNGTPLGAFQLTIDSAAVTRGSFTLVGAVSPGGGNGIVGDRADFISATTPFGTSLGLNGTYTTFGTQLTFSPAGTATGVIGFGTDQDGFRLSGGAGQFSGGYGGDQGTCGANLCRVSGQLLTTGYTPAAVPEPLSAALLLTGLVGLGVRRRRR